MKKTLRDICIKNKKVLLRVDYNVPLDKHLEVLDDERIIRTVPTIQYILRQGASIILMSHLGRPKGHFIPSMSLYPVAKYLSKILNIDVKFFGNDCISNETKQGVSQLQPGEICLLENLRFHCEEEGKNSLGEKDTSAMYKFAQQLATMGTVFVQDAFGVLHREHASTVGIVRYISNAVVGFLVENELKCLSKVITNPLHPFLLILGGAKVTDKIKVIHNLVNKVSHIALGGAMAYTFLFSQGIQMGHSIVDNDQLQLAKDLLRNEQHKLFILPIDHVIISKNNFIDGKITDNCQFIITKDNMIYDKFMLGVDIGPRTVNLFTKFINLAKTIVWNGPLGVFESNQFSKGTTAIAKAIAQATRNGAFSIIGGGDSVAAVKQANVNKDISHISTGGGASLAFLSGTKLPGLQVLPNII
ncbi:MAG: phosphoglycerate kinase [Endomicrobium sp.]|jgi:phosphoglycerate kinase|nr:phosphoglycerate kinase [Endomicrobium sp.]